MAPETAVIIGVALTAAGTLANSYLVSSQESRRQRDKESLEALLGVHDALTTYEAICSEFFRHSTSSLVNRQLDTLKLPEATNEFRRTEYILILHAPELVSDFKKISERTGELAAASLYFAVSQVNRSGDSSKMAKVIELSVEVSSEIAAFKRLLATYAREKYASDVGVLHRVWRAIRSVTL